MARNWAICVGVNEYHNLPSLSCAVTDAEKMRDWFVNEAGFGQDNVYLFTDNSPPIADASKPYPSQPNYATLIRFLTNRFKNPFLSAGDNLWFFFSGHGIRHAERDYLMLSDSSADAELIERTAIPLSYVTERLRRCGADNVVVVQDACRNQLGTKGLGVGEEHQAGVITFTSCSPAERSYEIEALQQGSFTYALLESLRLQGEGNCATVERLYQRLRYRVAEINQQYNKPRQTPYAIIEPATKYHLILLPKHATLRDIDALKIDALRAQLDKDFQLAEQIWKRILAVSPTDPEPLEALKKIWQHPQEQTHQPQPTSPLEASSKSAEIKLPPKPIETNPDRAEQPNRQLEAEEQRQAELKKQQELEAEQQKQRQAEAKRQVALEAEQRRQEQRGAYESKQQEAKSTSKAESKPRLWVQKVETEGFLGFGKKNVEIEMISLPGGKFQMGSADDGDSKPQHWVNVSDFSIGKYPVTQTQWQKIMGDNPSRFKDNGQNPVERVSWNSVQDFCQKLSQKTGRQFRLPSEAEWEYACRAGTTTAYSFGNDASQLGEYAWYSDNSGSGTHPVGQKKANAWGIYDMHGNVWEWCADDWHENYEGAPTDGSIWIKDIKNYEASMTLKLLRGGSWTPLLKIVVRRIAAGTSRALGATTTVFGLCASCGEDSPFFAL